MEHRRTGLALIALGVVACLAGCSAPAGKHGGAVGPPVAVDTERAEAAVAEVLRETYGAAVTAPDDAQRRGELALAYDANGFKLAAMRSYEQASALQPDEARWSYLLALLRAETGDLDGALRALDGLPGAAESYLPVHLNRGQWLLDLDLPAEAESAYRRAIEIDGESPAAALGMARTLLKLGRPAEAAEILENLALSRPRDPYLHQLLGSAYRDMGDLERARPVLARVRPGVDPPRWPDSWSEEKMRYVVGYGAEMQRGELLLATGRFQEAADLFEALNEQRPADLEVLNNLSVAYRRSGELDRAVALLEGSVEDHPDYFPFHLNLSTVYEQQRKLDLALVHAQRAIELNPSLAHAHQRLGMVLARLRRFDEALEAFGTASNYDPSNAGNFFYHGALATDLGQWEIGASSLEVAVRLDPDLIPAHLALARCRAQLGDLSGAERALDRAEERQPGNPGVARLRKLLAELKSTRP